MKRSRHIDLSRMRKQSTSFKPTALAMAVSGAVLLSSCSGPDDSQPAVVFENAEQCKLAYPDKADQCDKAYKTAAKESIDTAPKYSSLSDCEAEFGVGKCVSPEEANQQAGSTTVINNTSSGSGWFMPALGGFMLGQMLSGGFNQPQPVYAYNNPRDYGSGTGWYGADGTRYGGYNERNLKVGQDAFKPKPKSTKTIRRGGFGSVASAKSWSSSKNKSSSFKSSKRSSWGG